MKKSLNTKSNNGNNIFHQIFLLNDEDERKKFLELILMDTNFKVKYIKSKGLLSKF